MKPKIFALVVCGSIWFLPGFAQKQTLVGLNLTTKIASETGMSRLMVGLTAEKQWGKHRGGETGIYYFSRAATDIIPAADGSGGTHLYQFTVARRYVAIPVLYKYYSRFVNLAIGPSFDFYVGWRQRTGSPVQLQNFSVSPKAGVRLLSKVGKIIPINERLVIEPEVRFTTSATIDQSDLGVGIGGKYRF